MRRRALVFAALVVALTVAVALAGASLAGPEQAAAAAWGAGIGCAFQLLSFWAMVALFPGRQMLAFGLGMLGRFALVAGVALVVVPLSGLAAAPTLFALVAVLFATSVLEPVFLAADTRNNVR